MVFFNYATMQMAAKIVYYGPGLCGKTTNLHWIYAKTAPLSRGEMVSLETETDRTLFFDLLPIDVGVIGGFKTRLQLYTVPGQVFYNTTRKLVLKGVDGIVFVADSQKPMLEACVESLKNLRENLAEMGLDLDEIPVVLQLNKRDLPNIADRADMVHALDPNGKYETVEASAVTGTGVFETLKTISKFTLRTLRKRMSGDEPARQAPARRIDPLLVHGAKAPGATVIPPNPAVIPAPAGAAARSAPPIGFTAPVTAAKARSAGGLAGDPDPGMVSGATIEAVVPEPSEELLTPMDLPDISDPPPARTMRDSDHDAVQFSQAAKKEEADSAEVKHVKVRSSIDIMAELEALRKRSTQTPPKVKKEPSSSTEAGGSREIFKTLSVQTAPGVADKARRVRLTVAFEDDEHLVLQKQDQFLEWQGSEIQSLLVNLKIDLDQ